MRELPILFKTEMVQAIIAGTKNQTRRTAGLERMNEDPDRYRFDGANEQGELAFEIIELDGRYSEIYRPVKSRYQKGDHIWVKETYFNAKEYGVAEAFRRGLDYMYRADSVSLIRDQKWKPSLFMPKVAARIWLECTGVRCERLQDITEQDAIGEGITLHPTFQLYGCPVCSSGGHKGSHLLCEDGFFSFATTAYKSLWHSINGVESWNSNPWVFIYDFKRIEQ